MSRHIQVTFDARDPQALSSFWRDVLGYVHPGPPGVDLPEGGDPLAAWDDFLERIGVPEEQRNTRSALEDPDCQGPRLFFQQVPGGQGRQEPGPPRLGNGMAVLGAVTQPGAYQARLAQPPSGGVPVGKPRQVAGWSRLVKRVFLVGKPPCGNEPSDARAELPFRVPVRGRGSAERAQVFPDRHLGREPEPAAAVAVP